MRFAIWNFSNFSNLSWRVAYLKLSDETWNEMCYLKLSNLKLFKLFNWSQELLIWNFQMRLEWDMLFETFWNLKLSDEILNEIDYLKHLKCLKLETVSTCHGSYLFQTFRWDLKKNVIFETFETFQIHQRGCLFETFRWDLKWDLLFETFDTLHLKLETLKCHLRTKSFN